MRIQSKGSLVIGIYCPEPYPGGEVAYVKCLFEALCLSDTVGKVKVYTSNESILDLKHEKGELIRTSPLISRFSSSPVARLKKLFLFAMKKMGLPVSKMSRDHQVDMMFYPYISADMILLNTPYIVNPQDLRHKHFLRKGILSKLGVWDYFFEECLKGASAIIVDSDYNKEDIMRFYDIPASSIHIVHSMPDLTKISGFLEKIQSGEGIHIKDLPERYIFYPAHLIAQKNHLNLLDALSILKDEWATEIPLLLTGGQPELLKEIMYKAECQDLDVRYLGYLEYDKVLYLMKNSIAMIFASLFDPYALPIWEAFYLDVPVLSSNVCGLPEQVGDAGLLFDPSDPADIAGKIKQLISDEDLRQDFVMKGKEKVKGFTLKNYSSRIENILEEVVLCG